MVVEESKLEKIKAIVGGRLLLFLGSQGRASGGAFERRGEERRGPQITAAAAEALKSPITLEYMRRMKRRGWRKAGVSIMLCFDTYKSQRRCPGRHQGGRPT